MIEALLIVGLLVAAFVGFNIGGSNIGVAFGPAVGSGALTKLLAGVLMGGFALLGGWTVGRAVVDTLGNQLLTGGPLSLTASIGVLFFIGAALLVSNLFGVPASTSMTAVGSLAGLGLANGTLNVGLVAQIAVWWLVAPIVGFWASAVVGRYAYDRLTELIAIDRSDGPLFVLDRSGAVPRPVPGPDTTTREVAGTGLVVGIGCYMAFSAGASNVANAVAPLVGNGSLTIEQGVVLAAAAMGLGGLTIGRRTLDTMGNELTELPLVAAIVVATVSATLVTGLSAIGIPASFVVIATMSIVGLGWGRASRAEERLPAGPEPSPAEIGAPVGGGDAPAAIDEGPDAVDLDEAADLYRPATTARVVLLQNLVPGVATVAAYLTFRLLL